MTRMQLHRLRYLLADVFGIVASYLSYNTLRYLTEEQERIYSTLSEYLFNAKSLWVGILYLLFWLSLFALSGYYNKPIAKSRISELLTTVASVLVGSVIVFLLLVVDDIVHDTALYLRLFFMMVATVLPWVYFPRLWVTTFGIKERKKTKGYHRVLLIGSGSIAEETASWLKSVNDMATTRLHFVPPTMREGFEQSLKSFATLVAEAVQESKPHQIILAVDCPDASFISLLLYQLYPFHMPVCVPMRSMLFAGAKVNVQGMKGEPMVDMTATNMSECAKSIKWFADRLFSLLMLILLIPVYAVIAVLVKRSSRGPVFFGQERIGLHGRPFTIYKFRTMYLDAEKDGPSLSFDGDSRVTPIGRILRKYRMDELPQFWNVLRGDMSFVGPRPERAFYIRQLVERAPYYYLLHNVRPGITSWGMVRYGYASTPDEMLERLQYDFLYYENMSLRLDIEVLLYTCQTIFKGLGK